MPNLIKYLYYAWLDSWDQTTYYLYYCPIFIIDQFQETHIPMTSAVLTEHVLDLVHRKYFRGVEPVRQVLVVVRRERKRPGAIHSLVVGHEGLFEVEQAEDEGCRGDDASIGSGH